VTDGLTIETHAETTSGVAMGGGGAAFAVGNFGVGSLAGAYSSTAGRSGGLASASFERITRTVSVSGAVAVADRGFRDIAAAYGDPVPRLLMRASFGLSLGGFGSFGLGYVRLRRDATSQTINFTPAYFTPGYFGSVTAFSRPAGVFLVPVQRVSLLSASYSKPLFDNVYLYATGFHDFAPSGSSGFLLGLTVPLGSRSSVSASGGASNGQGYAQIQATQSTVDLGDVGWQVLEDRGQRKQSRELAVGEY
jgi:outer membrane usher protein